MRESKHTDASAGIDGRVDEDETLRLSVIAGSAADLLDLSTEPARRLVLTLRGNPWNPETPTTEVRVRVRLAPSVRLVTLRQLRGHQTAVVLDGSPDDLEVHVDSWGRRGQARLVLDDTQMRILIVRGARVEVRPLQIRGSQRRTIDSITLNGAEAVVGNRNVSDVRLVGSSLMQFPGTPIGLLLTTPGCQLRGARQVHAKRLVPLREPNSDVTDLALLPGSVVEIQEVPRARVVAQEGARLTVDRATDLTFRGPGTIEIRQWARNLVFDARQPVVDLRPHATVVGARGRMRLGAVAEASIAGVVCPPHRVASEATSLLVDGDLPETLDVTGTSLVDAAFSADLAGISVISALAGPARHVAPLVHAGLPGMVRLPDGASDRAAFGWRRVEDEKLLAQAEFARALSSLASAKGAPASARAQLAWCRYRMRNLTAPARNERLLLSAYRLIGYGERIGPPLVLFAVLTVIMNQIALLSSPVSPSLGGVWNWLRGLFDWAITPLHLLRLTEPQESTGKFSQPWDTLARLVLAVPFATALLVLRKYVKEDDRSS